MGCLPEQVEQQTDTALCSNYANSLVRKPCLPRALSHVPLSVRGLVGGTIPRRGQTVFMFGRAGCRCFAATALTAQGRTTSPPRLLCQLPPAADMPLPQSRTGACQ